MRGGGLAVGFSLHCIRKADSKEEVGRKSLKALAALSDLRMEVVELKGCLRRLKSGVFCMSGIYSFGSVRCDTA